MAPQKKRSSEVFPRDPGKVDLGTLEGITSHARFYVHLAANIAGGCMTDHLDDQSAVRDMHDIIGALGAAANALELLAIRQQKLMESGQAGNAAAC